jgi:hypothetical protein
MTATFELNGGVVYGDARWPEAENAITRSGLPIPEARTATT